MKSPLGMWVFTTNPLGTHDVQRQMNRGTFTRTLRRKPGALRQHHPNILCTAVAAGYYTPNSTYAHQLVRLGVQGIDSSAGKMPTAKPNDLSLSPESTWWNGENWLPSKCPLISTRVLWHMCTCTHMQINKCNKWNKKLLVNPKFLLPQRHQPAVEENL